MARGRRRPRPRPRRVSVSSRRRFPRRSVRLHVVVVVVERLATSEVREDVARHRAGRPSTQSVLDFLVDFLVVVVHLLLVRIRGRVRRESKFAVVLDAFRSRRAASSRPPREESARERRRPRFRPRRPRPRRRLVESDAAFYLPHAPAERDVAIVVHQPGEERASARASLRHRDVEFRGGSRADAPPRHSDAPQTRRGVRRQRSRNLPRRPRPDALTFHSKFLQRGRERSNHVRRGGVVQPDVAKTKRAERRSLDERRAHPRATTRRRRRLLLVRARRLRSTPQIRKVREGELFEARRTRAKQTREFGQRRAAGGHVVQHGALPRTEGRGRGRRGRERRAGGRRG